MTLSSPADETTDIWPKEQLFASNHQQNYGNTELAFIQRDTGNTNDDSGYAEFVADLQNWDPSPIEAQDKNAEIIQEQTTAEETYVKASSQHDSSILCLDTSPPSSPEPFENIVNHSQFSTSSLESYLPDFSVMAPQPVHPNSRPMAPFARHSMHRLHSAFSAEINAPPSSVAEPPPPTFCLPSPKHEAAYSTFPISQAAVSEVPLSQDSTYTHSIASSPAPLSHNSVVIIARNLLDEADPWEAIGRLLNLKTTSGSMIPPQSSVPLHQMITQHLATSMNDRSGVGYVAPQAEEIFEDVRDVRMRSEILNKNILEEHANHSNPPFRIQRYPTSSSSIPTRQTMDVTTPTDPRISSFLASRLTMETQRADIGGDFANPEPPPFIEESFQTAWPTLSDNEDSEASSRLRRCSSEISASIPVANPSPSFVLQRTVPKTAERAKSPVEIPNYLGPCLFFDLDEDDEDGS